MKKTLFAMMAATAAILVGCDWGGAGDGTWNDAYSWANFSGTYNLTQAIEGGSSKYVPKTEPGVSAPSKSSSTGGRVDSSAVKVGPIEAGSVSIRVVSSDGDQKWAYTDDGSDTLEAHGDTAGEATFIHKTGVWSIKLKSGTSFASGDKIIISYNFIGSQSDSGNPKDNGAITITWLNVNQQGNVFTFTDNMGVVYSGKITGASMPGSGYTVAGNVRLSFEVSAANGGKIVGSFNGDWSGASDAGSGTLYNRSMNATYRRGKTSEQINAVSGSVAITPSNVVGTEAAY